MQGTIGVRINDKVRSRNVTKYTNELRFSKSAYGGDIDVSCIVTVPRHTFEDLGPGDNIVLFDTRTGEEIWSGNTDNPGVTIGQAGERYDLQGFGSSARLQAVTKPLGYVVTTIDLFNRSSNSVKGAQTQVDERADGSPTLMVSANEGKQVTQAWQGEWATRAFKKAELTISRVRADYDAGLDNASYQMQIWAGTDISSLTRIDTHNAKTTTDSMGSYQGGGEGLGAADIVAFRVSRNDSAIQATDNHWFEFWNILMRQSLKSRFGNSQDGADYSVNHVYSHQVIIDMIGRNMAPGIDPDFLDVPNGSYQIDNLAWLDGVTFADAMEQLRVFEPGLWWMAQGKRLEIGYWDDRPPRYVIGKRQGGITSPGEEFALCNRIAVRWVDSRGRDQVTIVRTDIEGLDYTRDAEDIELPEGVGSEANARRAGEKALELLSDPPRAGTAVIRQKIRDEWLGCWVWPHEIEPGCRVREQESGDILRLTEVEYNDPDGAATLTLGEPVRSIDQYMARLHKHRRRRRRRR